MYQHITNMFNYCICQIGNDKHATSLLFFIKDTHLYVASFNSGNGINFNNLISTINSINYYSPYKAKKICNNFIGNQINGLKIILSLLIIPELYKSIQPLASSAWTTSTP